MIKLSRFNLPSLQKTMRLFATVIALSACPSAAVATETERWKLAEQPTEDGEYLVYRLSYRGLFTTYLWKDLADVAFISTHKATPFKQQSSCDLRIRVTTENFALAEFLRSTRYEWRSTVDPRLRRTFLIEETDDSNEDEQTATWVDWVNQRIELFRQKKRIGRNEGNDEALPADSPLEKLDSTSLPPFLDKRQRIDGKIIPLAYYKSIDIPDTKILLDPLSLIYAARWHNYNESGDLIFPVIYEDKINNYRVRSLGIENIDVAGKTLSAHRMTIKRAKGKEAKEEGFLDMWLSNDEWRIPLKFEIQAKVGKIKVHIKPESLHNNQSTRHCTTTPPRQISMDSLTTNNRQPHP